jgi:hypothetical protein
MKKNCYEYEGNGGPQSKELTDTQHLLSYTNNIHSQVPESKYLGVGAYL